MNTFLQIGLASVFSALTTGGVIHVVHAHFEGADEHGEVAEAVDEHAAAHSKHWGYDGEEGPDHWSELDGANELCAAGSHQSPIDLDDDSQPRRAEPLKMTYKASRVNMVNNGHTIQYNYEPGSYLSVGGKTYEVVQAHFHASSEHTVYGVRYPLEMHIVHKAEDGTLAVVGVLFKKGKANKALDTADWVQMPSHVNETFLSQGIFDLRDFVPGGDTWRYSGSLTTPPCSEGVAWHVYQRTLTVSAEQLAVFTHLFDHNYRPTQEHGAMVYADEH